MGSSDRLRTGVRAGALLAGFLAGFLVAAGVYGLVYPERLVEAGLTSVAAAYVVGLALILVGAGGFYVQRYARRRLGAARERE